MSNITGGTQSLEERELFITNDLLPNISKMRRYLGAIDYNSEFYRHKRQGQTSWEFEDRDTKTTFEASIIGEIADATHGTLLKAKGNYKPLKTNPNLLINDKINVKNIVVLRKLAGATVKAEKAFLNQTVPLNNVYEDVVNEDVRTSTRPTNYSQCQWISTSAAADADHSPSDLIVVSLLKKFEAPKPTAASSTKRVTERMPLTDDDDKKTNAFKSSEPKVVVGAFYEPSLLPDYSPDQFNLEKNKLVQHDIRDIHNCLIPAWQLEQGLRPGTVILVSASLHVYNIDNTSAAGFRRYYQINAERIKVLANPLPEEPFVMTRPESTPPRTVIFDDFVLFTPKKRKEDNAADEHIAKRNKTVEKTEDFIMLEQK